MLGIRQYARHNCRQSVASSYCQRTKRCTFGMFLAIIVPPSRKNKTLLGIVLVSFAASFAFAYLPVINQIDEGTRTIILTIVISAAAALLFPVKEEEENENVA